jgi:ABC-2 type transport system ATP-binding protein
VGYIYMSKLVALGTVSQLEQLPAASPPGTVRVQITHANPSSLLDAVRAFDGVREATIFGRAIHALIAEDRLDSLRAAWPEAHVEVIDPTLEDLFVTLTNGIMEATR